MPADLFLVQLFFNILNELYLSILQVVMHKELDISIEECLDFICEEQCLLFDWNLNNEVGPASSYLH